MQAIAQLKKRSFLFFTFALLAFGSFKTEAQIYVRNYSFAPLISSKFFGVLYFLDGDSLVTHFHTDFYRGFVYTNFSIPKTNRRRDRWHVESGIAPDTGVFYTVKHLRGYKFYDSLDKKWRFYEAFEQSPLEPQEAHKRFYEIVYESKTVRLLYLDYGKFNNSALKLWCRICRPKRSCIYNENHHLDYFYITHRNKPNETYLITDWPMNTIKKVFLEGTGRHRRYAIQNTFGIRDKEYLIKIIDEYEAKTAGKAVKD